MNTKEYIATGILENYLLDNCSEQERREVECLSKIYPEIKEELHNLEVSLENYAMANKKELPDDLWDAIEDRIKVENSQEIEPITPNVKQLSQPQKKKARNSYWQVAAAIALLVTSALAINFYQKSNRLINQFDDKTRQVVDLEAKLDLLTADFNTQNTLIATLALPETKRLVLDGIETKAPESKAYIVYNPQLELVYLNAGSLPENPTDMQYQLWALIDGQPISLGVFDKTTKGGFLAMSRVSGAQAFAVTLEEAGGKPEPNLEELYVLGEVG